jgi:hypothetical protein
MPHPFRLAEAGDSLSLRPQKRLGVLFTDFDGPIRRYLKSTSAKPSAMRALSEVGG